MDDKQVQREIQPVASERELIEELAKEGDEISLAIQQELTNGNCTPGTLADWRVTHLRTRRMK